MFPSRRKTKPETGGDLTSIPSADRAPHGAGRAPADHHDYETGERQPSGDLALHIPAPPASESGGGSRMAEGARSKDEEAATPAPPAWERAATFVLSFEQRQAEGQWERQLVAQQTELEVDQAPASWPGWDCSGICDWLQERLGDAAAPGRAVEPQLREAGNGSAPDEHPGQPPSTPVSGAGRGQLRITLVAIADGSGSAEIMSEGRLTAQAVQCTAPGRLEVTVTGAGADREVRVALRFARQGQPGWSPRESATMSGDGMAELDLSDVAAGQYEARILAWTPDASAEPAMARLGMFSIRQPTTSTPHV
jgi:hypothetical protein